jgi:aspartate/methionine/tyrosine aminotransferase
MEWAKTCSAAPYNLATSGLTSVSSKDFPILEPASEITGPGGYGFQPLQERLAQHTAAPIECIVAATGASMANYLAMSVTLNPGDEVLIEHPAYSLFADVGKYLQARVKCFPREFEFGFTANVEQIASGISPQTKLIVLSNLHNPSGALLPEDTVRAVGELAIRSGAFVLLDEVYLEMLFDTPVSGAFAVGEAFGGKDNPFIVTNSLTKTYGLSGLRCGWILARPDLAHRMWRLNDLFGVNAAHIAEEMSVAAFARLHILRDRARDLLATNRQALDAFLDAHNQLECFRPPGGSVVFPRLCRGDAEEFVALLRHKYETSVVPGKFFGSSQHFRMGIGGDTVMVRHALDRMSEALTEFSAR